MFAWFALLYWLALPKSTETASKMLCSVTRVKVGDWISRSAIVATDVPRMTKWYLASVEL